MSEDEILSEADVMRLMLSTMRKVGYGGKSSLARAAGIKQQNITEIQHGRRPLSPKLLAALGVERVIAYRIIAPPVPLDPPVFTRRKKTILSDPIFRNVAPKGAVTHRMKS